MRFGFLLSQHCSLAGLVLIGHRRQMPDIESITVIAGLNDQLQSARYAIPLRRHESQGVDFVPALWWSLLCATKFDLQLPRDTREQSKSAPGIDKDELLPEDLVFFKGSGESGLHVGIYDTK